MLNKLAKKRYFNKKIKATVREIWDREFKLFKFREIREEVRQERDDKAGKVFNLETSIKEEAEKLGISEENLKKALEAKEKYKDVSDVKLSDETNQLLDKRVLLIQDIERHEAQMKAIDLEMYGTKPTNDYPDGVQGIDYQIDSFVELRDMFKSWKKTL